MTQKNLTELVFIIDRSGSMYPQIADTIGGFNSVIDENRALPGEANITTILFDTKVHLLHNRVPVQAIRPMTRADYQPTGCTALLDAVGTGITMMVQNVRNTLPEYRPQKVQFVIITDGLENASKEYHLAQIRSMIQLEREVYGWDFLFLGANMDAVSVAGDMGILQERAVTAMGDGIGTRKQYEAIARANSAMRTCDMGGMPEVMRNEAWKEGVVQDVKARGGRHRNGFGM